MADHYVDLEVRVRILTTEEGEAGINRYVGLPEPNEWQVTPGMSKEDVLTWVARSCVYGRSNANQDGFADLDPNAFHAYIDDVREL